jgi:hypothetical protein
VAVPRPLGLPKQRGSVKQQPAAEIVEHNSKPCKSSRTRSHSRLLSFYTSCAIKKRILKTHQSNHRNHKHSQPLSHVLASLVLLDEIVALRALFEVLHHEFDADVTQEHRYGAIYASETSAANAISPNLASSMFSEHDFSHSSTSQHVQGA